MRTKPPTIVGHQRVQSALGRAVAEGRLSHAYLFHGPAGVGKSTLARWLAMRLNCTGESGESGESGDNEATAPCGACASCRRIARGADPNVRLVQSAAEREPELGLPFDPPGRGGKTAERAIGVDLVRDLQHDAALRPASGQWKVYLIVGAENLSLDAANRLLKTLEEPPPSVVLILTAVDPDDLLPTVVSRCQTVRLAPVDPDLIAADLAERHGVAPDSARLLARLSGGRPGAAIRAASDPGQMEERDRTLADLEITTNRRLRERLAVAERLAATYSKEPAAVQRTLATWQGWWWDVYLAQEGLAELVANVDRWTTIERVARWAPPAQVRAYLRRLSESAQWLGHNVNPRLALEATVLAAPTVE